MYSSKSRVHIFNDVSLDTKCSVETSKTHPDVDSVCGPLSDCGQNGDKIGCVTDRMLLSTSLNVAKHVS